MFETKRYMNTPNGKAMLKFAIDNTKAVLIGAGAGLSASAGYVYNGERFDKYFGDFGAKYGYDNMYAERSIRLHKLRSTLRTYPDKKQSHLYRWRLRKGDRRAQRNYI